MPRIANFSGGLNKRLDPTRVPTNQGVEFKNIDNSSGILKSAKNNKLLPDLNRAGINSVAPENQNFTFRNAEGTNPAYTSVIYNPSLFFGPNKQYRIWNIHLQQVGDLIIQGDVLIPAEENYQIILTTLGDNPTTLSLLTSDGRFNSPRDSSVNQLLFTLTDTQRAAFFNRAFGIIVLPVSADNNNPRGLDANEILSRLRGNTFFREAGSSMIEYNSAGYFTRENGKPLKIYGTTRNFNDISYNLNQPHLQEFVCFSSTQNQFQRVGISNQSAFNSPAFNLASSPKPARRAHTTRMSGTKLLRFVGKTLYTTEINLNGQTIFNNFASAAPNDTAIPYLNSILDAEAIPAYTFKFLVGGKLVIGDRIEFDLSSHTGGVSLVNYDTFPRLTVLDYPTNFIPDVTKTDLQNLNALRETILQTKLLIYTNGVGDTDESNRTVGRAHIITFTRTPDNDTIPLSYEPATADTSTAFPLTTTSVTDLEILGADNISQIDRHIAHGLDSNGLLNEFQSRSPLYAKVQNINMDLGNSVRAIQVDRDSNHLWVMNIRRVGDPRLPTGSNSTFDLDWYNINKDTGAVSVIKRHHPINLATFSPRVGYWARPNGSRIRSELEVPSLMEDKANLSLTENLGIEPPPREDIEDTDDNEDNVLKVLGFTEFNPQDLTFPANIDINVTSKYRSVQGGGGESTRSARAYEREVYENSITIPVRVIIDGKEDNEQKVVREYMITLDDEAIIQTSKDECRTKGSFFSRRIECRRQTTTVIREGITIDLDTYYSDNTNAHDIEIAIGIPDAAGNTVYRQLPGKLSKANRSLTSPSYIIYADPTNLAQGVQHTREFTTTIGTEYTAATQAVTDSCRLRYCYTYYNSNRDLESAPSKITNEIAVSRNDPVDIEGFELPDDPQVTDIRLYRICPDLGETAFTLIEQLPIRHIDGSLLPEITTTDELTRADLGDLTYNNERQLVYRENINAVFNPDGTVRTPATVNDTVIVNADGTRNMEVRGFDEQYNSYLNANGRILDSWDNLPPPPTTSDDETLLGHIKYLIPVRGALVAIIGQRIYWSQIGFPDYWPAQNFLDFSEEVTGIIEIANGLLVFTRNETHLISNFPDPANISRTIISSEQGCVHIRTPQFIRGVPVWISNDGVCTFVPGGLTATSTATRQNGRVEVISRGLLGDEYFKGNIITTEVHNDVYYILYDNRIVTMDQRYVNALQSGVEQIATNFVEYDTNGVRWIEKFDGEDILYGTTSDNTVVEMFAGDGDLSITYLSPIFTLSADERVKRFNDLYVAYKNNTDLNLEIILHGYNLNRTTSYVLPANISVIERHIEGGTWYGIQFKIVGKGEVSAIGYTAIGSQKKGTR